MPGIEEIDRYECDDIRTSAFVIDVVHRVNGAAKSSNRVLLTRLRILQGSTDMEVTTKF
jgi:hypothetical protein